MQSPRATLSSVRDRAAEITWWNRRLTKLDRIPDVGNLDSFLGEELIRTKGPYVEFVEPPAADDQPAVGRLETLGFSDAVRKTLVAELFDGDETGTLYQHQAEMLTAIREAPGENILTVPTATGKTETFLLPVLESCLTSETEGLTGLIIYPMKTLAVDQLNRFVRYLQELNRTRSKSEQVTIGIWDGDTPARVGTRSNELEAGSYVRGLEDPLSGAKLQVDEHGVPGTADREYPWLRVTRDRIKEGCDILLTNPEALDHLMVSNDPESRGVLRDADGVSAVEHIVYDEAHVWSGVMGAGIRLLNERLQYFYRDSDPQCTLVSATIKNPEELATQLTGSEEVTAVGFTPASLRAPESIPSFDGIEPCSLPQLGAVLGDIYLNADSESSFVDAHPDLEPALTTLQRTRMVTTADGELQLAESVQSWLPVQLDRAIQTAISRSVVETPHAVFHTTAGREHVIQTFLEHAGGGTAWSEWIETNVPHVAALTEWFTEATGGPIDFRHIDDIERFVTNHAPDTDSGRLKPILAFGRLAGVVTDRHHAFIKPPRKLFQCPDCRELRAADHCPDCDRSTTEIQCCRTCHYPFYVESETEEKGDSETTPDDEVYRPVEGEGPVERCPDCDKRVRTGDIGVPTSSLLSFMLSEMVRETPSDKTLVFSDSHSAAESVAKQIQQKEYGLMAETLYVRALRERGGTATLNELFQDVEAALSQAYYEPFHDSSMSHSGAAYNMVRQLRKQVTDQANLQHTDHLLSAALVTSEIVYQEATSASELVIGHELYKLFADQQSVGFSKKSVSFNCLTIDKVYDRVSRRVSRPEAEIEPVIDDFLRRFLDAGIVHQAEFDSVRSRLNSTAASESQADELFEYLIDQGDKAADRLRIPGADLDSGLLTRRHKQDNSELRLLPKVSFCETCHTTQPALESGEAIEACTACGHPVEVYSRFTVAHDGTYEGTGVADIGTEHGWALDHWANDIMQPLLATETGETTDLPFVTVGIHKANIPATLRGVIEEGFRKADPEINVVSSTPTMELGVDIGTLETVAQVGIPPTLTNYVQRSGRTGRSQGSSSLVTTVTRGKHPVDNHYYQDLESRFFDEFEPVRVPPATEFDQVVAAHVVTEVFAYLARNTHRSNVFERSYVIGDRSLSATEVVAQIQENLAALVELITGDWEDRLRDRIETIFGKPGLDAFKSVFVDNGSLNLLYRAEQTYAPLTSGSAIEGAEVVETAGRLNLWLNQLGYLASYRSFGQEFPIEVEGYTNGIQFKSTGRLYDTFPGPENGRGAVFSLGGQEYLVDEVQGGRELTTTAVCANDECPWPYQSYPVDTNVCPYCGEPLTETSVHTIESVHSRAAGRNEQKWTTRGLQTRDITLLETENRYSETGSFAGIPMEVISGAFELTNFVYAFERFHSSSDSTDVIRSQAEVDTANGHEPRYAPIGTQYRTSGVELRLERSAIQSRLGTPEGDLPWPQIMVSLQQAVKRAVSVVGHFDLGDFNVTTSLDSETVSVIVTDSRQGGNGVAWHLVSYLEGSLINEVTTIVTCENCHHYCEECLLLPRTPASYLENGLLDRQPLVALLVGE